MLCKLLLILHTTSHQAYGLLHHLVDKLVGCRVTHQSQVLSVTASNHPCLLAADVQRQQSAVIAAYLPALQEFQP
jgi:hypothetical protein